ncbi:hypothetical protein [Bradyrhizobium murdochi]|nr:hypothetical protein [Bradyrhizobium murdochi]
MFRSTASKMSLRPNNAEELRPPDQDHIAKDGYTIKGMAVSIVAFK